jgi:hypothetical protein
MVAYRSVRSLALDNELGGTRMECKTLWKNFLLLTVGGLLALHLNVSQAAESSDKGLTSSDATDDCILEAE